MRAAHSGLQRSRPPALASAPAGFAGRGGVDRYRWAALSNTTLSMTGSFAGHVWTCAAVGRGRSEGG